MKLHALPKLTALINYFLFIFFNPLFLFASAQLNQQQQQQQQSCANSGRFMQAYCLADYNCNVGRRIDLTDPNQRQVCIRGWCCSQTSTTKEQANVFLQQDQSCPSGTFNVGLSCQTTEQCVRASGVSRLPFPVLECGGQGFCCTSSRYRKPLQYGALCLNGGTALGQQCQSATECRRPAQQQPLNNNNIGQFGPVCIDNTCCTQQQQQQTPGGSVVPGGGQFDDYGGGLLDSSRLCTNGGHFTGRYCSGLDADECGNLLQMAWTAVCLQGRCCTTPVGGNVNPGMDDFDRGQAICSRYQLQYNRQQCQSPANCGYPLTDYSCISGYCCAAQWGGVGVGGAGAGWDSTGGGWNAPGTGGWVQPNGPAGFCPVNGRFSRFLGQNCVVAADCSPAFDQRTRAQLNVRCIGGKCCGDNGGGGFGGIDGGNTFLDPYLPNAGVGGGLNVGAGGAGMIPVRYAQGYCYDGSPTTRQCFSRADCQAQESCVNNVCCPNGNDQDQYACGGLQANDRCGANGVCPRGECVSASFCCECPYGQPQMDVNNCGTSGSCKPGYMCNRRSGFCCPQCPGGRLPFGSCYLGRCASGFTCNYGNICCEGSANELGLSIG